MVSAETIPGNTVTRRLIKPQTDKLTIPRQYPIINYPVFNANNSTNTSEYFSLSLNTVNRKGNLRLPEFGQDDILVKPTSINNWILLPSEGCFGFLYEKCTKFNKIFLSAEETMYRNSLISAV